jgi:hypothetical protein
MLSARNQFKGIVKYVKLGNVMAEVFVSVGDIEVVSLISHRRRNTSLLTRYLMPVLDSFYGQQEHLRGCKHGALNHRRRFNRHATRWLKELSTSRQTTVSNAAVVVVEPTLLVNTAR